VKSGSASCGSSSANGSEDFLIEDNRSVHDQLNRLGIPHHYSERPGEHTWSYWDVVVQEALGFIRAELGI